MTAKVTELPRPDNGVRELLEGAMGRGFDEVVIVGWRRGDKTISTAYSRHISRAKLIGGLEEAKFRLLNDAYNRD